VELLPVVGRRPGFVRFASHTAIGLLCSLGPSPCYFAPLDRRPPPANHRRSSGGSLGAFRAWPISHLCGPHVAVRSDTWWFVRCTVYHTPRWSLCSSALDIAHKSHPPS
jgi:hypothetical protein